MPERRRASDAGRQLGYLIEDLRAQVNGRWWRWSSVPFAPGVVSVAGYRLSRSAHLAFGRPYAVLHTLLAPLRLLTGAFGARLEIHYRADIGPGLRVLHPGLGVVVAAEAVVGRNLVLAGGNCLGARPGTRPGDIVLGDGVSLGVNAVVLGPIELGDRVTVGAGAVVVHDTPSGCTVVGQPARPVGEPVVVVDDPVRS